MPSAPARSTGKVEIIQLQAFLRLRKLGYTASQIDREMVLPQAAIPDTDADGLLWVCGQRCVPRTYLPARRVTIDRDSLEWPGTLKNTGEDVRVTQRWDVASRVDSMLRQFCPHLNCIQPACPSHGTHAIAHRVIAQPRPQLTNAS